MREFIVSAGGITLAGANTLVFINPPAAPNPGLRIMRVWVSQSANNTSAQQRVQLVTQVSVFPTLVTATPTKVKQADAVSLIVGGTAGAAGTCGINASAEGAGAKSVILDDAFNVLDGWEWKPNHEDEFVELPAGSLSGFGLFFPVAPATLTNWAFGVLFAER